MSAPQVPGIPPAVRSYIYAVALAAAPILVALGWIADGQLDLWLALSGAVLAIGGGTGVAYRPTGPRAPGS